MYHGVKNVKAIEGYRLIIGFDNGESRVFNVKPLLSLGRFCELTSQQEFMKAKVAFDTVEWENGLDLDPEYLYERSEAISCEQSATGNAENPRP
jgi:hypothetical protein